MSYLNTPKKTIFFLYINQVLSHGVSCVEQLITITHEIYKVFDSSPSLEVQGVFLDISKAFDKFWYDGLSYKLKRHGIDGDLLKLI